MARAGESERKNLGKLTMSTESVIVKLGLTFEAIIPWWCAGWQTLQHCPFSSCWETASSWAEQTAGSITAELIMPAKTKIAHNETRNLFILKLELIIPTKLGSIWKNKRANYFFGGVKSQPLLQQFFFLNPGNSHLHTKKTTATPTMILAIHSVESITESPIIFRPGEQKKRQTRLTRSCRQS